jgi:protochlorophyllide reductase
MSLSPETQVADALVGFSPGTTFVQATSATLYDEVGWLGTLGYALAFGVAAGALGTFLLRGANLLAVLEVVGGTPLVHREFRRRTAAPAMAVMLPNATVADVEDDEEDDNDRTFVFPQAKNVIVTGASSGLGLNAVESLVKRGYTVVCAVRNPKKMRAVARQRGFNPDSYVAMKLDLTSLQSVKDFVSELKRKEVPINDIICNAGIYLPKDPEPAWTEDGFESTLQANHLGHFLLVQLLLPELKKGARCCIVGSVTGNKNTIAGSFVKPVADVGELKGLGYSAVEFKGEHRLSPMVSSPTENFSGAKAYKDAKALNMMTVLELHRRFADKGVYFTSMYPGCIADTALFRNKRGWFRFAFPLAMRTIGAYVSESEAGDRLAQVIDDPRCAKSGVYWSWNGNAKQLFTTQPGEVNVGAGGSGGGGEAIFENEFSTMVNDEKTGKLAWDYSMEAVKKFL